MFNVHSSRLAGYLAGIAVIKFAYVFLWSDWSDWYGWITSAYITPLILILIAAHVFRKQSLEKGFWECWSQFLPGAGAILVVVIALFPIEGWITNSILARLGLYLCFYPMTYHAMRCFWARGLSAYTYAIILSDIVKLALRDGEVVDMLLRIIDPVIFASMLIIWVIGTYKNGGRIYGT